MTDLVRGVTMTDGQTCFLLAGVGGLLPTLSKIAASFAAQPDQPLPNWHIILALAIFFIIGACLNIPFNKENDFAKAIVVGIAAPALITNIISGVATAPTKSPTVGANSWFMFSLQAVAQERPTSNSNSTPDRNVIQINLFTNPVGKFAFQGVTRPLRVSYKTADGQLELVTEVRPGSKASFVVPTSAIDIVVAAVSGAQAAAHIPSNARTVDIRAEINIAPKDDFLFGLGAPREGAIQEISLNVVSSTR